ncbi:flagellar basal body-associated protein FliL [Methylocystis sp. Sn-Cys]|uniref:flagellar basal body-associated protein FliL n=1 Tax=Methylocystis sp. Sn-Cys TaxID=1701263 RepID=UPI0019212CC8|nr:flagellar basal body-associated protein FliL [Methylocystis sp. Sn-Cys]MBL1258659.1 flagellar basal body-associated protein FliL [Methylocystis sp. Sn-Cys]
MIRTVLVGLWCGLVALASTYGGAYWQAHRTSTPAAADHPVKTETKKVKPISVPVISNGVLRGYVSVEFMFVMEASEGHGSGEIDPEGFLMDEAFRLIYSDTKIDFAKLEKMDIDSLTKQITANVNARLGNTRIKETLVKNLTFVPKDEIPR